MSALQGLKYWVKDLVAFVRPRSRVRVDGLLISGRPHDFGFLRALKRGEREPYMFHLFQSALDPAKSVLDIGAHLGHYSLSAAKQLGAEAQVLSFEADPATWQVLRENIEQNQLSAPPRAYQVALTDRSGTVTFHRDVYQPDYSSISSQREGAVVSKVEVPGYSLDEFLRSELAPSPMKPVGVIKMDIEGAEILALKGAATTIRRDRPIMFVESNPSSLGAFGADANALVEALRSLSYDVQVIDEAARVLQAPEAVDMAGCIQNLICRPL